MGRSRLGIIGCGIALLASGCGGGGEEQEILDVIVESTLSADPGKCERVYTLQYMENRSGESGEDAIEECRKRTLDRDGAPDSVQVEIERIDDDYALTSGTLGGGSFDGATFKYVLRREDDAWMIDALTDVEIDRADYDAFAIDELIDEGLSPSEAGCAVAELRTLLPTEELEEATRTDEEPDDAFFEAADSCLSVSSKADGIVDGLRKGARERGIDDAIVSCAAERIRDLPKGRIRSLYSGYRLPETRAFLDGLLEKCLSAAPTTDA